MLLSAWYIYPPSEKNGGSELSEPGFDSVYIVRQGGMEAEHPAFSVDHLSERGESV